MNIFDEIAGVGAFGSLLGAGLGIPTHASQLAAMLQQQQKLSPIQAQYLAQAQFPYEGNPFVATFMPRKHVESRELTPREKARKQINGAVQAVKDAQEKAKNPA